MAAIAPQVAKVVGTAVTFAAASAGGDTVAPNPTGILHVKNGSGASITVTVVVPGNTEFGQAAPDIPVVVAAGGHAAIGPLNSQTLLNGSGLVDITYSGVTSLTVAYVTSG